MRDIVLSPSETVPETIEASTKDTFSRTLRLDGGKRLHKALVYVFHRTQQMQLLEGEPLPIVDASNRTVQLELRAEDLIYPGLFEVHVLAENDDGTTQRYPGQEALRINVTGETRRYELGMLTRAVEEAFRYRQEAESFSRKKVDGAVLQQSRLPSANNQDGEVWFVTDERQYYQSNGSSWSVVAFTAFSETNLEFNNLKELSIRNNPNKLPVYVRGLRGGFFDPSDIDPYGNGADGVMVVKGPTDDPGWYVRRYNGPINAQWFGAKGDGIVDDTDAIQASIDFASSTAGTRITLPRTPDAYRVSSLTVIDDLDIESDGAKIAGQDRTLNVFDLQNAGTVRLQGLHIDADFAPPGGNDGMGKGVKGTCDSFFMRDCTIHKVGIWVKEATDVLIEGNKLDGHNTDTANGILLRNPQNYRIVSNHIFRYKLDGVKISGEEDGTTAVSDHGIIVGNVIHDMVDDDCIDVYSGGRRVIISSNVLYSSNKGINLKSTGARGGPQNYSEHSICANNIVNDVDIGINTDTDSDNYIIQGNYIQNTKFHAIRYLGNHAFIVNNTVVNSNGAGIVMQGSEVCYASGNVVRGSGTSAIHTEARRSIVTGGYIYNPSGRGVRFITHDTTDTVAIAKDIVIDSDNGKLEWGIDIGASVEDGVVEGVQVTGATTAPIRDNSGTVMHDRNSWTKEVGPTTERPTAENAYPGKMYFDTDLAQPIWRNSSNSGWVDAKGNNPDTDIR